IKNSSGEIVVFMDGDMQHDPQDIPKLVEPILANDADLTLSVRTLGDRKGMPTHRRFTNFCGNFLIKIFVGYDLKDTQSGFRAVRREFLRKMHFESVSYEVEMEMLIFAKRFEMRIVEVPIEIMYGKEKSHFKLRDILRIVKIVLEGRVR
ncbi:MAG: glycosyltransferase family 2 protein, partial [Candidatus Methanofastidiosia archaeon]